MRPIKPIQVGDITVQFLHGGYVPPHKAYTPTIDWSCDVAEIGRTIRGDFTNAFLSGHKSAALPIKWGVAIDENKSLRTVANEIAGSVLQLAERRRIKLDPKGAAANPFTLFIASDENSSNKNRALATQIRKQVLNAARANRAAQNRIG